MSDADPAISTTVAHKMRRRCGTLTAEGTVRCLDVRYSVVLAVASLLTACGDASAPSSSTTPMLRATRASAYPVASATVRVLPGLDGATPRAINDHDLV